MGRLLGVCVFAGLVFAQDAPVCTVSGTITDASSGAPIQKATLIVTSRRPPASTSVTSANTSFTLRLDPGVYGISVVAEGHSRRQETVDCTAGAVKLNFALPPEAVISGRVTDDEGHAVPGAWISLLRVVYVGGVKRLVQTGGSRAGDDGEYRLDNVAAGSYCLLASTPPDASKSSYVSVPTYYPSAIEAYAAAPIRVRPGEISGTDIRIKKARAFSVRGKLSSGDELGEFENYVVRLLPADFRTFGLPPKAFIRDNKGQFEFTAVAPGAYTLMAEGIHAEDFAARMSITVGDHDVEGADLVLAPGNPVAGSLNADDKEQHPLPAARIDLYPKEDLNNQPPAATATDGRFAFPHIAPALYYVVPSRLSLQTYGKALQVDGRDSTDWTADLTATGPHSLEIVLGFDAGRIGGFVRDSDGDPAPKMLVALVPSGDSPLTTPQFAAVYSDDHGRYAFTGVQPGKYKLFAFEHLNPRAIQNRQTLRQFETLASKVEVQPNAVATADVNVIAASATATIE
jgi:protocatechuate 3,4-dioxygenase beta subunit